ncbi:MAG: hypothetical protein KDA41_19395, partial [Planctomycetales bacterium]|nr:hypothetical protein [Planctomycetales bacterium]
IRRDEQRVHLEELCHRSGLAFDGSVPWEESFTFAIPADAMHSYKSKFNAIHWRLVIEIDAEGWPPHRRAYPLLVYPRCPNNSLSGTWTR